MGLISSCLRVSNFKFENFIINIKFVSSNLLTEEVFIHPESCLFRSPQPNYVIFQELSESTSGKTYMKG